MMGRSSGDYRGITSTLITDSHAITRPSLTRKGSLQGGGTRRGLLLHVSPFLGLTDRWMMLGLALIYLKKKTLLGRFSFFHLLSVDSSLIMLWLND
jgi:hypothetical protein